MKHYSLLMILFISSAKICGQTANEQAVKKNLQTLIQSLTKNDAAAAGNLLADDYKMQGHSQLKCITTKAQRLASIQAGEIKYEPIDFENKKNNLYVISDTTAAIFTDVAVTFKTCENNGKYTARTCTFLFIKREDHWLISSECVSTNCVR